MAYTYLSPRTRQSQIKLGHPEPDDESLLRGPEDNDERCKKHTHTHTEVVDVIPTRESARQDGHHHHPGR